MEIKITKGVIPSAVKTLIYGPEGIGKSTLASKFPDALFIDTEGSTKRMDVSRLPSPETWQDLLNEVNWVSDNPESCKTLVIDTLDWAEAICIKDLFDGKGVESPGYGKGYVMLADEFMSLLKALDGVIAAGIHVVCTAHAAMRKFEQPDEMGAYDRWEMKLQKKTAPLVKEWADMVLFCNYKTTVVNIDGQGAQKGKNKAMGGERVMYTTHHNCWDAKNRFGLPDKVLMDFESISNVISDNLPKLTDYDRIPDRLKLLMERDNIAEFDIQNLVGAKGFAGCDSMTPIHKYPADLINFLVGDWEKVKEVIANDKKEIPFDKEEDANE